MELNVSADIGSLKKHLSSVRRILGGVVPSVGLKVLEDPRLWASYTRRANAVREVLSALERSPTYAPSEAKVQEYRALLELVRLGDSLLQQQQLGKLAPHGTEPRQIQKIAFQRLIEFCQRAEEGGPRFPGGVFSTHLDCATGIGKTAFFLMCAAAAKQVGQRVVVFTPYVDLIEQTVREAKKFAPDLKVGWSYAESCTADADKDLVLVTYQGSDRACSGEFGKFSLGFLDEVHLALTPSRRRLPARIPGLALAVGLTGSPRYTAEKHVARYFGPALLSVSLPQAIRMGQLAPMTTVAIRTNVKMVDPTISESGELGAAEIDKLVRDDVRNKAIISILKSAVIQDSPHGTLVSCFNTEHVERLMKLAKEEGLEKLGELHYKATENGQRVLEKCLAGDIRILFVVRKTIGLDLPNFKTLVNGRESFSEPDATQRAGRIARLYGDAIGLLIDILDRFETYGRRHPITGYQLLGGEVLVPEERRDDPAIRKRLGQIREAFEKLELPQGYEVLLTPEQLMKVAPEAAGQELVPERLFSVDEVRQILQNSNMTLINLIYDHPASTLASTQLSSDNPMFNGSVMTLVERTDSPRLLMSQARFARQFSKFAEEVFGDMYWEELRSYQFGRDVRTDDVAHFLSLVVEKVCPLGEVFIRPHPVGKNKSRESGPSHKTLPSLRSGGISYFGTDVLRVLGISSERCDELDLSQRISRELVAELCQKYLSTEQSSRILEQFDNQIQVKALLELGPGKVKCSIPLWQLNKETFYSAHFTHPDGFSRTGAEILRSASALGYLHIVVSGEAGFNEFLVSFIGDRKELEFGRVYAIYERHRRALAFSSVANSIADRVYGVMRLALEGQLDRRLAEALRRCPADYDKSEISIPGLEGEEFTMAELGYLAGSALKANRAEILGAPGSPQRVAAEMLDAAPGEIWERFCRSISEHPDKRVSGAVVESAARSLASFDKRAFFGRRSLTGILLGLGPQIGRDSFRLRRERGHIEGVNTSLDAYLLGRIGEWREVSSSLRSEVEIDLHGFSRRLFTTPVDRSSYLLASALWDMSGATPKVDEQFEESWGASSPGKLVTVRRSHFARETYSVTLTAADEIDASVLSSAVVCRVAGSNDTTVWYVGDVYNCKRGTLSTDDFDAVFKKIGEGNGGGRIVLGMFVGQLGIRADLLVHATLNVAYSSEEPGTAIVKGFSYSETGIRSLRIPEIFDINCQKAVRNFYVEARLKRIEGLARSNLSIASDMPVIWSTTEMKSCLASSVSWVSVESFLDSADDAASRRDFGQLLRLFRDSQFQRFHIQSSATSVFYLSLHEIANYVPDQTVVSAAMWRAYVEFAAQLRDRSEPMPNDASAVFVSWRRNNITAKVKEFLGLPEVEARSGESSVALATQAVVASLPPSAKLEANGPHFTPDGKLVVYQTEMAGGTYFHYSRNCRNLTQGSKPRVVVATDVLGKGSGGICCKNCGTPQPSQVAKIESTYSRPQTRSNRTVLVE